MSNLKITIDNPWVFLLLIPAIALALVPYFRLAKKYRCTRNRVTSIVLHLIIMVLSVSVLSGALLTYKIPNYENEVVLVVDVSYSNREAMEQKNEFVKQVLEHNNSVFKVGIVTFAREPYEAASLSYDTDSHYESYLAAPRPTVDDSATNISKALLFAKSLIENPEAGKIVLISDGIETDETALSVIMATISEGIKVDTVYFGNDYGEEVQIVSIELPNYNVGEDETVNIGVTVQSTYSGEVTLTLHDNGVADEAVTTKMGAGMKTIDLPHKFTSGAHQLYVEVTSGSDVIEQNNIYYSYIYIAVYDKLLILSRNGEADLLEGLIENNYSLVESKDITEAPVSLSALSQYDQVILVNIANSDLPAGFDQILHEFVYELGGGLLTVGGKETGSDEAHAYDMDDMNPKVDPTDDNSYREATLFQQMLPVECIEYTPPIAVMFVVDRSGSMNWTETSTGKVKMDVAKDSIIHGLDALSERDYVGVISFAGDGDVIENIGITSMPNRRKVEAAIASITATGGTEYADAINRAAISLNATSYAVQRKHIIFISDGAPQDTAEKYNKAIDVCISNDITMSYIAIMGGEEGLASIGQEMVDRLGNYDNGEPKGRCYDVSSVSNLTATLKNELSMEEIRGYIAEPFTPTIGDQTKAVEGVVAADIPSLEGYYGVKAKSQPAGVVTPLMGPYTPIYAQWNYGTGRVGSFMCDLSGVWSGDFMSNEIGQLIINNIIKALLPTNVLTIHEIKPNFVFDNYNVQIQISTALNSGDVLDFIDVTITDVTIANQPKESKTIRADASSGTPKCTYTYENPGIYEIRINGQKKNSSGEVIQLTEYTTYVTFSYSAEYDAFPDSETTGEKFLTSISQAGGGNGTPIDINDPEKALGGVTPTLDRTFNPRITFIILIIILFLLDIAVRKFKFKWPWEMVRDHKLKKALK